MKRSSNYIIEDIDIEQDLLRELEELAEKHEQSSPRSNESTFSADCRELNELLGREAENDAKDGCASSSSPFPGYDLFQSASEVTSHLCGQTFDEVTNVRHLFCEIDNVDDSELVILETENERKDTAIVEDRYALSHDGDSHRIISLSPCTSICNDAENDSIENDNSSRQIVESQWMQGDEEEAQNEKYLLEESLLEIERESKEERSIKQRSRTEIMRRREIMVSKERVECARCDNAVYVLQSNARRFVCKVRADRAERRRTCAIKISRIGTEYILKQYILSWRNSMIHDSRARIIACWLKYHCHRKKERLKAVARMRVQAICIMDHILCANRCRMYIRRWSEFVVIIQRQEQLATKRHDCSVLIQCLVRGYFSKRHLCNLRTIRHNYSTLVIQCNWRSYLARTQYSILAQWAFENKYRAAVVIQKVYRSVQTRQRFQKAKSSRYSLEDQELDDLLLEEVESMLHSMLDVQDEDLNDALEWKPQLPKLNRRKDDVAMSNIGLPQGIESPQRHVSKENSDTLGEHGHLMNEWHIKDERVIEVSILSVYTYDITDIYF